MAGSVRWRLSALTALRLLRFCDVTTEMAATKKVKASLAYWNLSGVFERVGHWSEEIALV
ncbi:hypothetical protein [Sodalis sp.]|uniref:hypothetical protein n=1 Tax=Sodalis sp. (in: enterobacteria) TaxID=1898979 RepID=UPI003872DA12